MIATVHPIATDAGLAVFHEGGNAVDAAVTAALTLGVVDGENSGIGGGCLILIRTADGRFTAIDGREMARTFDLIKANDLVFRYMVDMLRELGASHIRVIVGGGGHGLATAHYLAKTHGITNVAVVEKGYLGSGNVGRNTTIVRSNYLLPGNLPFYEWSMKLWEGLEDRKSVV